MRFELRTTSDGSRTVFDAESGECFKSRHAARLECEQVFYLPGVLENPWLGKAEPFRVLELGFGLGTNFLHLLDRGFCGELSSIERDLAGAEFLLANEPNEPLAELIAKRDARFDGFHARILHGEFSTELAQLPSGFFHAIFFDPFSPKANPEAWTASLFRECARVLIGPGGRVVTYSVSRAAKDAAAAAGLEVEKRDLPPALQKRAMLLARKP